MAAYDLTNADIIKGGHLMVFMDNEPIAFATSHSLDKTLNTQEVSTKDHGDFTAILPQNITWEVSTENLYSLNGYHKLNDAFNQRKLVTLYFGETTYSQTGVQDSILGQTPPADNWAETGFGEQGQAYITSLSVSAPAGENATFTATFTGTGSLTIIGHTPTNSL